MFGMITNLAKAVVSVASAPVLAIADLVTLPADAVDGGEPFERTAGALKKAGQALDAAVSPTQEDGKP